MSDKPWPNANADRYARPSSSVPKPEIDHKAVATKDLTDDYYPPEIAISASAMEGASALLEAAAARIIHPEVEAAERIAETGDHLRMIIERVEMMFQQRASLAADIRDVFAFAKGIGLSGEAIRACVKAREMDPDLRKEKEAILEVYRQALGIEGPDFVIALPPPGDPPPVKAKKLTAKERQYREVLALTQAAQSMSTH